jgi:glucose/mannose-6-phosphate isomerase
MGGRNEDMVGPDVDLDDVAAVEATDRSEMLRAVASSAAQVRMAASAVAEVGLSAYDNLQRPRAIVCVGMGGSGIAGDVLAAIAGPGCPVPIWVHKNLGLPGWVGANDVVIAVSCSGTTQETLSAAAEAGRRGAVVFGVGAASSPLAAVVEAARGAFVPAPTDRQPRASLWSLAVPGLMLAEHLGLLPERLDLEAGAARLESVAQACHVGRDSLVNPAKSLALRLEGDRVAQIWGCSSVTAAVAYRFACQLNENAKMPAVSGVLPEAAHNQIVAFDGGGTANGPRDIFADPYDDDAGPAGLGRPELVQILVREPGAESASVSRRADVAAELAAERGLRIEQLAGEGATGLERLASLVCLVDFASVYAGIAAGYDPTPVSSIAALKRALD